MSKTKWANFGLMAIILIVIAAFFVRFNNISWETYGYGEIELKQAADEYIKGNFVNNFYIFDTPPLAKYMFAASILILGNTEFALRIIPLLFGIFAVFAAFFAVRKMYNERVALLTSIITAFSILQIEFSRYAQLETILTFFYILIVYFLWEAVHDNRKYTFVFLGVSLGLALAVKFTSVIVLVAALIYILYTKQIKFSIKPNFSMNIKNWLLKALVIMLVVFLVSWPFGFSTLHTEANISVNYGGEIREQHIEANVPIVLLSFSRRIFSSVDSAISHPLSMNIPVLNYFFLYIVKESLLLIVLVAIGVYFVAKKPLKEDKLIIIFILTFLALLSFQRTVISYRHITPLVPFFAILASRWVDKLKDPKRMITIAVIAVILFWYAAFSGPSYALSYNPLKNALGIYDSEFRFSEGMRDTIDYVAQNCSSVFTSDYYKFVMEPYYDKFSLTASCAVKGVSGTEVVNNYIQLHACTLSKTITKNSLDLIEIYSC